MQCHQPSWEQAKMLLFKSLKSGSAMGLVVSVCTLLGAWLHPGSDTLCAVSQCWHSKGSPDGFIDPNPFLLHLGQIWGCPIQAGARSVPA